jgi:hypothetical protein
MTPVVQPRICATPGCQNPVPPAKPGKRTPLRCSRACGQKASRVHRREERKREHQAQWQALQPTTQALLEQVAYRCGPQVAEQLAQAIRCEREQPPMAVDAPRASA